MNKGLEKSVLATVVVVAGMGASQVPGIIDLEAMQSANSFANLFLQDVKTECEFARDYADGRYTQHVVAHIMTYGSRALAKAYVNTSCD